MKCYVAPWALAKEGLPIHMILDSSLIFDQILITLPENMSILNLLNVEDYTTDGFTLSINKLYTGDFFGLIITQDEKLKEIHIQKQIGLQMLNNGNVVHEEKIVANFYRPFLEVVEGPKRIVITDNSDLRNLLKFTIKVVGFGKVNITTEIDTGKDITLVLESYFRNLLRGLFAKYSTGEDVKPDDKRFENPEWILDRMKSSIDEQDDEIPLAIKQERIEDMKEWIQKTKNIGKILEEASRAIEAIFLDLLLFQFEKYPAENVTLSYGTPAIFAERFAGSITLRLRYWDSMGTEYEPVEIPIEIADERAKKIPSQIPMNIEWIRYPYTILGVSDKLE